MSDNPTQHPLTEAEVETEIDELLAEMNRMSSEIDEDQGENTCYRRIREEVKDIRTELRQFREEIRELATTVRELSFAIKRFDDNQRLGHEIQMLKLENAILRLEQRFTQNGAGRNSE